MCASDGRQQLAMDDGLLTQKQAILIGQGIRNPQLAQELVAAVQGLDERTTRAVVKFARNASADAPPAESVAAPQQQVAVQGVAVLGADVSAGVRGGGMARRLGAPTTSPTRLAAPFS